MFKARVVLGQTDLQALRLQIEAIALGLGLSGEPSAQATDASTRTWRSANADPALEAMHVTTDEQLGCAYLEFRGRSHDAVVDAVARAYAALPVRMPRDLVREAVGTWRDHPRRLPCAALAVTDETAAELGLAISQALEEQDPEIWNAAAGAAALMPAADARRILSRALASETSEARQATLVQLARVATGP